MGISSSSSIYSLNDSQTPRPIIPTIEFLYGQISSLAGASAVSLDALSGRIRQLTEEEKSLEKVQRRRHRRSSSASSSASIPAKSDEPLTMEDMQAMAAALKEDRYKPRRDITGSTRKTSSMSKASEMTTRDADKTKSSAGGKSTADDLGPSDAVTALALHPQTYAKVKALYRTLPTLERLHPILPPLLDRLYSLRTIHANAARASDMLDEVEKSQEETAAEITMWREGLDKVEARMRSGEEIIKGNVQVVEGWVKDIEERMRRIG